MILIDENNGNNDSVEIKMMSLLKQQPDITTKEIVKKLEITDNQVKYYVKKLKDNGKIKRVGTNRKGFWKIL
ncbi:MAG: winged helix-turn-helix domain-containing protein [Lachnospiraceae bacterium]